MRSEMARNGPITLEWSVKKCEEKKRFQRIMSASLLVVDGHAGIRHHVKRSKFAGDERISTMRLR